MSSKLSRLFDLAIDIAKLPVASLEFHLEMNPDDVRRMHAHCTKQHPRYKVFQNKSLGAALVDLKRYGNRDEYMGNIKGGRNSAEHYAKKATARGYVLVEIDRNDFVDDIHAINTSLDSRQGRPMDDNYLKKTTEYPSEKNYTYFGVLNSAGKLMAYSNLGSYGNFVAFDQLLGVRNNDGMMHLMLAEIISRMIESKRYSYLMYDTYFGASPGLQLFKKMLGFEPYRVKYSIQ